MAQAMQIGKYASISAGRSGEAYGAWYEGKSAEQYYDAQIQETMVQKEFARQKIGLQLQEAELIKEEAENLYKEAGYIEQLGNVRERKYKEETDKILSSMFSKMAKSGVRMDYGSPMDYVNEAVDDRAEDLGLLQFQNEVTSWQAQRRAQQTSDKATIMLNRAKVEEANLALYDWQMQLYKQAGEEAKSIAHYKQISAYLGAVSDVFGGSGSNFSGGGDMGGSGAGSSMSGGGTSYQ